MNFTEAFILAVKGKKITRREWGEGWVELKDNEFVDNIGMSYDPYLAGCECDDWEIYEEEEPDFIEF